MERDEMKQGQRRKVVTARQEVTQKNICTEYGLEEWKTPPNGVQSDRAKIMWDFHIQTDKLVMANLQDIVSIDKQQKKAVVIDISFPRDSNISKNEHKKLNNDQGLKEELEKM
ncbi:hypothetical protein D4764_08G0001790 [Scomber scombrus]|uniref:Uncharacterized protein n=1 Tax=Scomber scombrus TaxID=13677 RepID=A0AAV1PFK5_SCOSC